MGVSEMDDDLAETLRKFHEYLQTVRREDLTEREIEGLRKLLIILRAIAEEERLNG